MKKLIFLLITLFNRNNGLPQQETNPNTDEFSAEFVELEAKIRNLTSTVSALQSSLTAEKTKVAALEKKVSVEQIAFTACHTLSEHLGDHQAVIYNSVLTNKGKAYDASNGQFTAPVEGLYTFSFTGMAFKSSEIYLELVRNGANLASLYSNHGWADTATNMAHVHLNVGDKVWVRNQFGQGQLHPSSYTCLSGILQSMG